MMVGSRVQEQRCDPQWAFAKEAGKLGLGSVAAVTGSTAESRGCAGIPALRKS